MRTLQRHWKYANDCGPICWSFSLTGQGRLTSGSDLFYDSEPTMVARTDIHWITETGMFFERKGPVWDTLYHLQTRLADANVDYVLIGGLALNAHNYSRQTIDVDVVVSRSDFVRFRELHEGTHYTRAEGASRRLVDTESGVSVDFLIAGELAGRKSKNNVIRFPTPDEAETHGDLHTVSLSRLIELKLVTWRYKDWGDVVELIRRNNLTEAFAESLDPLVRTPFAECFDQATDEEYEG